MLSSGLILLLLWWSGASYILLALYAWQLRGKPAAQTFAWLMGAMAVWSLGYGLEIRTSALASKVFWAKVQYVGIVTLPIFWLTFVVEYTGRSAWRQWRGWRWLWLLPAITLGLVWTNEFHGLIWKQVEVVPWNGLTLLDPTYRSMFWVHTLYSYGVLGIGMVLLVQSGWQTFRFYRAQAVAILIAAFFPLVGNLAYLLGWLSGLRGLDPTPFLFLPSGVALLWALMRYRLLELWLPLPMAVLNGLDEGVLLLDSTSRILFMNSIMEQICGKPASEAIGRPVGEICANVEVLQRGEQSSGRLVDQREVQGQERVFEVRFSALPLSVSSPAQSQANLMVFHDITARWKAEQNLKRRDAILQAVRLAAEQFLTSHWEESVLLVLEQLGIAADVSRVYIFERHLAEDGTPLVTQRYEWVAAGISPQIHNPALQNLPYCEIGFESWDRAFLNHQAVICRVQELPDPPRTLLAEQDIFSLVVVPIFAGDDLWGFIGFDECRQEREWSEVEVQALMAAASLFGAAIRRHQAERDLQEHQQMRELLHQIIHMALQQFNVEAMAQVLVDGLGRLLRADYCFLTLWDERRKRTLPFASYGMPTNQYRSLAAKINLQPGERTLTQSVLEAGHLLVVEDVMNSPYISPRIASLYEVRSVLALPMIADNRPLGAVLIGFSQTHRFTPEEIEVASQATELVTLVLARSVTAEDALRRAEEAETLRRAGATVAETLNLQETITRILEQLAFVLPHDSASIQLLRNGELEIIGGDGWEDHSQVIGLRFPVPGDNPNTVVVQTCRPYLVQNAPDRYALFREPPHDRIRCWLGVPLMVRNRLIGLLAIDGHNPFQFTEADIELVSAFADQVAIAIENARLFDMVQQMAITDDLTGLFNRRHFMKLARSEFDRARRYGRNLAAMMFDLDHFKKINDAYGHAFGDEVLRGIASLCRERLREADPIGRYGGEEFAALIVEADLEQARIVGERLRMEVEHLEFSHERGVVRVTVSVGVAALEETVPDLEALIERADQALYLAKRQGRNRVVAFRNESQDSAVRGEESSNPGNPPTEAA